jgi:hypothetical protein
LAADADEEERLVARRKIAPVTKRIANANTSERRKREVGNVEILPVAPVTATCEAKHVGALLRENGFE